MAFNEFVLSKFIRYKIIMMCNNIHYFVLKLVEKKMLIF